MSKIIKILDRGTKLNFYYFQKINRKILKIRFSANVVKINRFDKTSGTRRSSNLLKKNYETLFPIFILELNVIIRIWHIVVNYVKKWIFTSNFIKFAS